MNACSAVLPGGSYDLCKNGFPMLGPCWTGNGVPVCCNEKLCGRLYPDTGKPPAHLVIK